MAYIITQSYTPILLASLHLEAKAHTAERISTVGYRPLMDQSRSTSLARSNTMFAAIAMFFRSIQGLLKVVDINVNTLEELSSVGNDMAKNFREEQRLLTQKRLDAISAGQDPDA